MCTNLVDSLNICTNLVDSLSICTNLKKNLYELKQIFNLNYYQSFNQFKRMFIPTQTNISTNSAIYCVFMHFSKPLMNRQHAFHRAHCLLTCIQPKQSIKRASRN